MKSERLRRTGLFPNLSLAAVALVAGFNWMPLRFLASRGLTSAWAGLLTAVLAALVLLPIAFAQRGRLDAAVLRSLVVTGLINGASMALYIAALLLTDVVRALVLFYLAPMWGVLMGVFVLHEKLTPARAVAVVLCLAGMLVILGTGHGWPWPRNVGDWLAVGCGLSWAYASLRIYAGPEVSAMTQNLCAMLGCIVISVAILLLLPAGLAGPAADRLGRPSVGERCLCDPHDHPHQLCGALERQASLSGAGQPDLRHRGRDRNRLGRRSPRRALRMARGAGLDPGHRQHSRRRARPSRPARSRFTQMMSPLHPGSGSRP